MEHLPKRVQTLIKLMPFVIIGFALIFIAADNFITKPVRGQAPTPGDRSRGGKLYIAWDLAHDDNLPQTNNPLWPESASRVPAANTWRCVNCHSWDYRGSSSNTQSFLFRNLDIPGLFGMMEKTQEEIIPWLTGEHNPEHDFSDYLTENDLNDLSTFLSTGLVTPDLIANVETNRVFGNLQVGEESYVEFCSSCHGMEGEKINYGTTAVPTFMGDMALANPWRVAHIVRYGHLAANVPPARDLGVPFSQQIDILAYTQTLPTALTIAAPDYNEVDFDSQASTNPLAFGAILLTMLVFGAVLFTLRNRSKPL